MAENNNALTLVEAQRMAIVTDRANYKLTVGNATLTLKRGIDFDNPIVQYGKKKGERAFDKPILQKAGAEKIAFALGLFQQYELISKETMKTADGGTFISFLVKCSLVKLLPDGRAATISDSYGEANTGEGRNGFKSMPDSINTALKMAQKRALVGAALAISGLSDMFTQDIENDTFMAQAQDIMNEKPDSPITRKQITRLYAIAAGNGINQDEAKARIVAAGYASTKDITQKDYERIAALMSNTEASVEEVNT